MLTQAIMFGGGKKIRSALNGSMDTSKLSLVAVGIVFFILKALVVQWSYNKVAPKLISNAGNTTKQFVPLTFEEALLFTLLITFLF